MNRSTAALSAVVAAVLLAGSTITGTAAAAPAAETSGLTAANGGGTLSSAEGRQFEQALRARMAAPAAVAAAAYPPCQGTFPSNGVANIIVQESAANGIPWRVALGPGNAGLGVVRLSAQIYADNRQANVYAPHTEPWNYTFHGPLPRTFQVIGGGTYKMPAGATVSFLFTWYSVAQPSRGGYAYLNCRFAI